jgi:hypothetical protein
MLSRYASDNNVPDSFKKDDDKRWPEIRNSPYWTIPEMIKLGEDLIIWAQLDTSIKVTDFVFTKNITTQEYREWQEKCPELKRANNIAKGIIGNRREKKGLEGTYNSAIVLNTMPLYDEDYAAWRKEQNASKTNTSTEKIIVVRETFPETDIVKAICEGTE